MKEYHCIICIQSKPIAEFSKWTANKLKSRRCDSCQDDPVVRARIAKNQRDSDAKSSKQVRAKTPAMAKKEQEEINGAKVIARRRIEDLKWSREYDDAIGL